MQLKLVTYARTQTLRLVTTLYSQHIAGCASVVAYIETYMTKIPMHTNIQTGYDGYGLH